jgi:hypothetical protein
MYSIEVGNFDDRCWLSDLIMSVVTQNYLQSHNDRPMPLLLNVYDLLSQNCSTCFFIPFMDFYTIVLKILERISSTYTSVLIFNTISLI